MRKYYKEVDGLRAIAVVAVIINHIRDEWLVNGFLGVDIFFIISGFVVTSSLLNNNSDSVKEFLTKFYTRRLKRLMPALIFCIGITSISSMFLVYDGQLALKTGIYAIFGLANMYLIKQEANYFGGDAALNPFTHNWSLGVEEQYYLLYPALMILTGVCVYRKSNSRNRLLLSLITLGGLSFIFYSYAFYNLRDWSFYSMPARFWQLSLGGIIACLGIRELQKINIIKYSLLTLLVFSLNFKYGSQYSNTVVTSIITFFLILSVKSKPSRSRGFLNLKLVTFTGLISYSLYLWHWPVLSVLKNTVGLTVVTIPVAVVIFLLLSLFSYYYIEAKYRAKNWRILGLSELKVGLVLILTSSIVLQVIVSLGLAKKSFVGERLRGHFSIGKDSRIWRMDDCSTNLSESFKKIDLSNCYLPSFKQKNKTVFIYGDSYAQQLVPAFLKLKDYGYNVNIVASNACPSFLSDFARPGSERCEWAKMYWRKEVLKLLGKEDKIVFLNSYYYYTHNDLRLKSKLKKAKEFLQSFSVDIYVGEDIPILKTRPENCIQPWSSLRLDCQVNMVTTQARRQLAKFVFLSFDVKPIEFVDSILSLSKRDNIFNYYTNKSHINNIGAEAISSKVIEQIL